MAEFAEAARQAESAGLVAAVTAAELLGAAARPMEPLSSVIVEHLDRLHREWAERIRRDQAARRLWQAAGLVLTCARGAARDGLLTDPDGFAAIDHLDFREWLAGHGASPETLDSPLVRGMYDLVFAYEGGDQERPRFAAGLGLFLASKLFFEYRGSIFWKMRAGMGEVVFAPLYQALRGRGVRFEFFSRVDRLHLSADRRSIAAVTTGPPGAARGQRRGLRPAGHRARPAVFSRPAPAGAAVRGARRRPGVALGGSPRRGTQDADRRHGLRRRHPGYVARHGAAHRPGDPRRLTAMAADGQQCPHGGHPGGAAVAPPHGAPTSARRTAPRRSAASRRRSRPTPRWDTCWNTRSGPKTAARGPSRYLCGPLADEAARQPGEAAAVVRRHAAEFLERLGGDVWPQAVDATGGFRWDVLADDGGLRRARQGRARLDAQYWTANVDPSDRYVQSPPGSAIHRLRADEAGYQNLFLAGDWTNCGLNAGCIEAAVLSGLQAANAVRGRPLLAGIAGSWYGLGAAGSAATAPAGGER